MDSAILIMAKEWEEMSGQRLKDKVVIITGASKGIGRGLALGLAREGANVVVNYNSDKKGAGETVKEIEKIGRAAIAIKADVSQSPEVNNMVEETRKRFGRIDALVNNAGVALWKPLFEVTEEIWDRVIDTNLKGTFLCSQAVAKQMARQGTRGRIVNITSAGGKAALKYLAPYCASKGGITLLTMELAMELAPYKINVNALGPGAILIERNLKDDPNYNETYRKFIPLDRAGEPEDIIGPVVFLLSEDSNYITGQVFYVDGGWLSCAPQPAHEFVSKNNLNAGEA